MKIRVALASFAVAALVVAAFAFVPAKKRAAVKVFYVNGTCNQKIPSASGEEDCRLNSLNSTTFTASNWSTSNSAIQGAGDFIANLEYSNTDYATLQAMLNDVQSYYSSHSNTLPANGQDIVVGTKHITVGRTNAAF